MTGVATSKPAPDSSGRERFTLLDRLLTLATSVATLAGVILGIIAAQATSAKNDLETTVETARTSNSSLQNRIDELTKELEAAKADATRRTAEDPNAESERSSTDSTETPTPTTEDAPSTLQQTKVLGVDIERASEQGSNWHWDTQAGIGGDAFNHAVSRSWVFGGAATSASIDYELGRDYKTFSTTFGQLDKSVSTNGVFRFKILLDGIEKVDHTLSYGQKFAIKDLNVEGVLRLTMRVEKVGTDNISVGTGFGDPTVRS